MAVPGGPASASMPWGALGGTPGGPLGRLYGPRNVLYVKNLSPLVTEEHLRAIFSHCSDLLRVEFKALHGGPLGAPGAGRYCELEFADSAGITAASQLNGTELLGLPMQVSVLNPGAPGPSAENHLKSLTPLPTPLPVTIPPAPVVIPPPVQPLSGIAAAAAAAAAGAPGSVPAPFALAAANPAMAAAAAAALPGNPAAALLPTAVAAPATPVTAVEIAMQNHLANLQFCGFKAEDLSISCEDEAQAVQAAAAQAKQLAARKKCELGLGVAVTAVDGRLPPAQSLVTGALFSETETDQLNRTCFLQGFPQDYDEREVSLLLNDLGKISAIRVGTKADKSKYAIVEFETPQDATVVLEMDGKSIGPSVLSVRRSVSLVNYRDPDGVLFDVPAPPILAQIKQQQQLLQSPEQQKELIELRDRRIASAKAAIERRLLQGKEKREMVKETEKEPQKQTDKQQQQQQRSSRCSSNGSTASDRRRGARDKEKSRSLSAPSRSVSPPGSAQGSLRSRRGSGAGGDDRSQGGLLRNFGAKAAAAALKERLRRAASAEGEGHSPRRRSPSPKRRSPTPHRRSPSSRRPQSMQEKEPQRQNSLPSVRDRSPLSRGRYQSPKRRSPSPRRRSPPHQRRSPPYKRSSGSPPAHQHSRRSPPQARSPSPPQRRSSPQQRRSPPQERRRSPAQHRRSPMQRARSPVQHKRSFSPRRRSLSPEHQRQYPASPRVKRSRSPASLSPRQGDRRSPSGDATAGAPPSAAAPEAGLRGGDRSRSVSETSRDMPGDREEARLPTGAAATHKRKTSRSFSPLQMKGEPSFPSPARKQRSRSPWRQDRRAPSPPKRGSRSPGERSRSPQERFGAARGRSRSLPRRSRSPFVERHAHGKGSPPERSCSRSPSPTFRRNRHSPSPSPCWRHSRSPKGQRAAAPPRISPEWAPPPTMPHSSRGLRGPPAYFRGPSPRRGGAVSRPYSGSRERSVSPMRSRVPVVGGGLTVYKRGRSPSLHLRRRSPSPRRGELRSWRRSPASPSRSPPRRFPRRASPGGFNPYFDPRGPPLPAPPFREREVEWARVPPVPMGPPRGYARDVRPSRRAPPPQMRSDLPPRPQQNRALGPPAVDRYKSQSRSLSEDAPIDHASSAGSPGAEPLGEKPGHREESRREVSPSMSPDRERPPPSSLPLQSRLGDLRRRLQSQRADPSCQ